MERRLTAILAADVAGYSRLMGQDEAATLKALKRHQSDLIVPKAAQYGGRIIKLMGDGVLMDFESVVAAVAFAVEVQSAMRDRNEDIPEERQIVYRIGINIGDVLIEGDDIYGDGVNIAARLEGLAEPGGICVARNVYNQVRDKLDLNVQDLGEVSVKNIVRPVHAFQIAMDEKAAALCTPIVQGAAKRIRSSRTFVMAALAFLLVAVGTGVWVRYADVGVRSDRDSRPSIAVLPFASRSGDTAGDYFADGLTQDVINALGRFSGLTVMSWNAVAQYKGKVVSPREVGRSLAVLYQVEGSIQQTSDRLRLTAQLVSSNGHVLWTARFDEALTELFALQDKLTTQIAGALAVGVAEIEQRQARAKPTESLEAYDYVLRARPALRNPDRAAIVQARGFLKRAIELDPNYAAAYAALAETYQTDVSWGWAQSPVRHLKRALVTARKALQINGTEQRALLVLGRVHIFFGAYEKAKAEFDRTVSNNPSDPRALAGLGHCLMWMGQTDASIEALELALRIDPILNVIDRFSLAMAYYQKRRYGDAAQQAKVNLRNSPSGVASRVLLAAIYAQLNRPHDAAKAVEQVLSADPTFDPRTFGTKFRIRKNLEHLHTGLRKAGFKFDPAEATTTTQR